MLALSTTQSWRTELNWTELIVYYTLWSSITTMCAMQQPEYLDMLAHTMWWCDERHWLVEQILWIYTPAGLRRRPDRRCIVLVMYSSSSYASYSNSLYTHTHQHTSRTLEHVTSITRPHTHTKCVVVHLHLVHYTWNHYQSHPHGMHLTILSTSFSLLP